MVLSGPYRLQVLPLDLAADAQRQMDSGAVFGRIVLTP